MRRRWRVEVKIDGQWHEKRFYTGVGARAYIVVIKWAADTYSLYLYKDPKEKP